MLSAYNRFIERIVTRSGSVKPKLIRRILYSATATALLLIGLGLYGLYLLDLIWYVIIITASFVLIFGARFLLSKGHNGDHSSGEDTMELRVLITRKEARNLNRWELVKDESSKQQHVLIKEIVRVKIQAKHWWSLRGRTAYSIEQFKVYVEDSDLVKPKLIKRSGFKPTAGEDSIKVFMRLHWWSHGPLQIVVVVAGLLLNLVLFFIAVKGDSQIAVWAPLAWIFITLILGATYFAVWIPWAFTYFIVTNQRVLLIYLPPLGLPGSHNQARIMHFQSITVEDQPNGPVWVPSFGNILWDWFSIRGYKIFVASTPAERDKWIEDGIPYMPDAGRVEEIVSEVQTNILEADKERHEEDMNWQRRQALAGEELLKVVRDHVSPLLPETQE